MSSRSKSHRVPNYLVLVVVFLLAMNAVLGYLMMDQSRESFVSLIQGRMLDISNSAAAMIDGDVLESVTPADKGTDGYEAIMHTLSFFEKTTELKYIYCIQDMGDGTFTFGLDPTEEDPGEFGTPVVYTDALHTASLGTAAADDTSYEDAWGTFYSAYSPVFDSKGDVAGIVAVDFSADWYNRQLSILAQTVFIVAVMSLIIGGTIVVAIVTRSKRRIEIIDGQLSELETTLKQEMGADLSTTTVGDASEGTETVSMDELEKHIHNMQEELKSQIAAVHGQAYKDGLTGVNSKRAYLQKEMELNEEMAHGRLGELAVVVCDINGLKQVNDTLGHSAGDEYIRKACHMICDIFDHSPVYRVGGDEFTAILSGRDYESRGALMHELHRQSTTNISSTNEAIVSGGMAELDPEQDTCIQDVFARADAKMYKEKMLLKSLGAQMRSDESEFGGDEGFDEIGEINVRKQILIVDDVETNREIMGDLLEEDYGILYASDGVEAMEMLETHKDEIALVLLDLYMPNMSGREVMAKMQVDEELMTIPIIVLTVDAEAELDCLKIGAMDFIPKPYPDIEIVKARISKCIELFENRDLIRYTQHDKLTGLYNKDFFTRYVNRFDLAHKGTDLDAIVLDINAFHKVNAQYGRDFGDLVLRSVGRSVRQLARKVGGIGCRQTSDTFLLCCPHRNDYEELLPQFVDELHVEKETAIKVSMRFGVYEHAQEELDIEERFARAKLAADGVSGNPDKVLGYYA